jgi:hypothetical protein
MSWAQSNASFSRLAFALADAAQTDTDPFADLESTVALGPLEGEERQVMAARVEPCRCCQVLRDDLQRLRREYTEIREAGAQRIDELEDELQRLQAEVTAPQGVDAHTVGSQAEGEPVGSPAAPEVPLSGYLVMRVPVPLRIGLYRMNWTDFSRLFGFVEGQPEPSGVYQERVLSTEEATWLWTQHGHTLPVPLRR